MRFQYRDANTRAKKRYIQRRRDRRYKVQMLWADIECKEQRDAAYNKNDDINKLKDQNMSWIVAQKIAAFRLSSRMSFLTFSLLFLITPANNSSFFIFESIQYTSQSFLMQALPNFL